jgi:hypothetical protein
MGHAHLDNLLNFFVRRLYAKGKLSIADAQTAASQAGETLHASEGEHTDPCTIRMGFGDVVNFLAAEQGSRWAPDRPGPVIEPVSLTDEQKRILIEWDTDDQMDWDCGEDGNGGQYGIFDSIEWKFAKGWRRRYPDGIPQIGTVTH